MLKSLSYSILLALLLTGCVFDDLSNCRRASISFFYSADGDVNENVIDDYITNGTLFIYDSKNQLVAEQPLNQLVLHRNATDFELDLKRGEYTLVCWGNTTKENSKISSKENLNSARIQAEAYPNKDIKSNDRLYFASKKIQVKGNNLATHDVLTFKSSHIKFDITVVAYDALKTEDNIKLFINNLMPQYNFEMNSAQEFKTTYYPDLQLVQGTTTYKVKANVLRFSEDNDIQFDLQKNGESLLPSEYGNLNKLLAASSAEKKIDFSQQEIEIPITIYLYKDGRLVVEVIPWESLPIIPTPF